MESCKLYDCMAVIIRYLLNENFEADMAYAVASNHEKNMLEEAEELLEEGFSLTDFSICRTHISPTWSCCLFYCRNWMRKQPNCWKKNSG